MNEQNIVVPMDLPKLGSRYVLLERLSSGPAQVFRLVPSGPRTLTSCGARLGDVLVVGVNSDDSVRRLKRARATNHVGCGACGIGGFTRLRRPRRGV